MPHWACRRTNKFELHAQLNTKDGRKIGNAYISGYKICGEYSYYEVTTQFNVLYLNTSELNQFFYTPEYVMHEDHIW